MSHHAHKQMQKRRTAPPFQDTNVGSILDGKTSTVSMASVGGIA